MAIQYISAEEAAKKWNISLERVIKGCETGQIKDAAVFNDSWIIPAYMDKPKLRFKREKKNTEPVSKEQSYKDSIYRMTMEGFPNFNVTEYKIGGTTYVVSLHFNANSKDTLKTIIMRNILNDIDKECGYGNSLSVKEKEAIIEEMRKEEAKEMPSGDELRKYYFDKFTEIGYSDEEMKVLMEKIDEHIANRNKNFGIK